MWKLIKLIIIYIKKIKAEWIFFNILIFKSKAIQTLYAELFEFQDNTLLEENELKIIFENIFYYAFPTNFRGLTMKRIMRIYEYGPLLNINKKKYLK